MDDILAINHQTLVYQARRKGEGAAKGSNASIPLRAEKVRLERTNSANKMFTHRKEQRRTGFIEFVTVSIILV